MGEVAGGGTFINPSPGAACFFGVLESGHPQHQVGFMFVPQGQTLTTLYLGRAQSRDGPLQIYPLHPQTLADPVDPHQRERGSLKLPSGSQQRIIGSWV